jgi:threonine/homoserine/homoserine lactone efflux protein
MSPAVALAIAAYAFTMSITPGPNNTMLLASGVNFGFRPTLPHIMGINLGFTAMLFAVGLGIGGIFTAFPVLHTVLKVGGSAYLLYLAWRIATAASSAATNGEASRPMTLLEAALFQWVNPKAWVISIGAAATYIPQEGYFWNLVIAALIVCLVNLPSIMVWAGAGVVLRRFLNDLQTLRIFNVCMALLLVASLVSILRG